jgi:pimeloyl-ACP methyl ester carboxylesterase
MLKVREYGSGPTVVLLHGGPGAPGSMASVAAGLADRFRVLEPWQRHSGGEALTVARHVADLDEVLEFYCPGERPALAGSSWGAMLALAYAAEHSERAAALALIGCGTFDVEARRRMRSTIAERMGPELREGLRRLEETIADPDERLRAMARLIAPVYTYEPEGEEEENVAVDSRGMEETWSDLERLQAAGVYPSAFRNIRVPVLMLHGAYDPHPGQMVLATLQPYLPQIEYVEWERCGHYPWKEKHARAEFFSKLREWLS